MPKRSAPPSASQVHDYRGQRGQLFYASPQQPSVPEELRPEVVELGRILSYTPHHTSKPWMLPMDVPDQGLQPSALLNSYNVRKLASQGFTGKGQTIVIFAFDGYDQADLDSFATLYGLPKFTPTLVGGQPADPLGETTMDLEVTHAIAPDAKKVVINARPTVQGDGAYEKIAQMLESADRAVPRRGVELLDRMGLRQVDHRRRSGAGPVRAVRRAHQGHNGFQRQRRPRRPGVQGRTRLVIPAERC